MNGTLPMVFNLTNYSSNGVGCLYDTASMIKQVEAMPNYIFWFVLASFILTIVYVKFDQSFSFKSPEGEEVSWTSLVKSPLLVSIVLVQGTSLFFLFVFTFHPSNEDLGNLQAILFVVLILLCIYIGWYHRKKIPEWIKQLKENELK